MKTASATAMISAAALLAPACGPSERAKDEAHDPVRRSTFRALSARAFLLSCPGSPEFDATRFQQGRMEELRQFALRKDAGHSVWLGENDWAAASRFDARPGCGKGDASYRAALAAFSASLDGMAGAIAAWQP